MITTTRIQRSQFLIIYHMLVNRMLIYKDKKAPSTWLADAYPLPWIFFVGVSVEIQFPLYKYHLQ